MQDDAFKVISLMIELAAQIWKIFEEFFASFIQNPDQSKQASKSGYEAAKKNYIGNMSDDQRAELEKRVAPVAESIGLNGKNFINGIEINQHDKLKDMQQQLNIKEDIKEPKQSKEEFVNDVKDKIEYKPPVFDERDLPDDKNAKICAYGGLLKVNNLDERGYDNGEEITTYVSNTKTVVPTEILVTGNTKILQDYLDKNPDHLLADSLERKHLNARIKTMEHVEKLGKYNNEHGLLKSVSDTKEKDTLTYKNSKTNETKQIQIIKGLHQEGKQTTGNGCWSCATEVLLQGQGINLDQKLIRAFRPDYDNLGEGPINEPEMIDTFNSDRPDTIMDHAELFGKVAPNTLVFSANAGEYGGSISDKASSLLDRNIPVAFLQCGHWSTVVGQDKENFYYFDSKKGNNELQCMAKSDFSTNNNISMTWLEPMKVNKDTGAIEGIDPDSFKVDKETGLVQHGQNFNKGENWDIDGGFKKDGNFSVIAQKSADGQQEYSVSVYVPKAYRKYEMNYNKQKELLDAKVPKKEFVKKDGPIKMSDSYGLEVKKNALQEEQWTKYKVHYPSLSEQAGKKEEVFKNNREEMSDPKKHAMRKIANKIDEVRGYINNLDNDGKSIDAQKLNEDIYNVALSMIDDFTPSEKEQVFSQNNKDNLIKISGQDIKDFADKEKKAKLDMEKNKELPYSKLRADLKELKEKIDKGEEYRKTDSLMKAYNEVYDLAKNKTIAMDNDENKTFQKQRDNLNEKLKAARIKAPQLDGVNKDLGLAGKKNIVGNKNKDVNNNLALGDKKDEVPVV